MIQNVSPVGRVAYPHLFKARAQQDPDKPHRYSTTLVFDESVDLSGFKDAVRAVIKEKLVGGVPEGFRSPFRKGTTRCRPDGTYPEGFKPTDTYVEFWRYEEHGRAPSVGSDRDTEGNLIALNPQDVYAGCFGRVSFRCSVYSKGGNSGASIHLEAFQKTDEGTPIGAAPVDVNSAFGAAPAAPAAPAEAAAPNAAIPPVAPAGVVSVDDLL